MGEAFGGWDGRHGRGTSGGHDAPVVGYDGAEVCRSARRALEAPVGGFQRRGEPADLVKELASVLVGPVGHDGGQPLAAGGEGLVDGGSSLVGEGDPVGPSVGGVGHLGEQVVLDEEGHLTAHR